MGFGQKLAKGCDMAPGARRILEVRPLGCVCSVCGKELFDSDEIIENEVLEFDGSLDYIELSHVGCVQPIH